MGPVRFGSVTVWRWNGSSGSGFRFRRFLCKKRFSVLQYSLTGKDGSGSGFGSWKTVPAVPVPLSVSGKTVPTVPVSGSGSVPEPPCWKVKAHPPKIGSGMLGSPPERCDASMQCTWAWALWHHLQIEKKYYRGQKKTGWTRFGSVRFRFGGASQSPKAGHPKAGRSDFRNQRFEPDTAKMRKMRKAPLTLQKQGFEESPQSKSAENAENVDAKTRKTRKMRMTGFNVTGFR